MASRYVASLSQLWLQVCVMRHGPMAWPYGTPEYIEAFLDRRLTQSTQHFRQFQQILDHGDTQAATLPAVWQVATESIAHQDMHLWRTLPSAVQHNRAQKTDSLVEEWAASALHIPASDQNTRRIAALPAANGGLNLPRPIDLMPIHRLGALLSERSRRCGDVPAPLTSYVVKNYVQLNCQGAFRTGSHVIEPPSSVMANKRLPKSYKADLPTTGSAVFVLSLRLLPMEPIRETSPGWILPPWFPSMLLPCSDPLHV